MRPVSNPTPHLQRTTPRSPMAASSPREAELNDMNDQRLKPRMLRSLVMNHLPDEKQPSPNPDELSSVLSSVKTHGLLSEIQSHPPDRKQIDEWRSSVDAWVERLLSLVSCNMPDKCWAGICLLGVTFEECNSERFLASYSLWFHKLLSNIQPPSHRHFVKVSSCASLSDLFTRLKFSFQRLWQQNALQIQLSVTFE